MILIESFTSTTLFLASGSYITGTE